MRKITCGGAGFGMLVALMIASVGMQAGAVVSNTVTGVTYASVKEAVDALMDDGQVLLVSPGIHTEPDEIIFRYAVTLRGDDAATTILQAASEPETANSRLATVDILTEWNVELPVVIESLTLRHGNVSGNGGALHVGEGTLIVRDCVVSDNSASGSGGGLSASASPDAVLVVENSSITRNRAGGNGGGMVRGSALHSELIENTSTQHGGGAALSVLSDSLLQGNQAGGQGGGLFSGQAVRSRILENLAVFGGGLYESTAANCLLAGNSVAQSGGGAWGGSLANCTVADNVAMTEGGGLFGGHAVNSIFHNNSAPAGADVNATASLSWSRSVPIAEGEGNMDAFPRFRDPVGGDYTLLSHSPCINAGNNDSAPSGTDLAGNARIQDGIVDMGAYEHDPFRVDYEGFSAWLERHGLPIDPEGQFGMDHDGDGVVNGLDFTFGANRIDLGLLAIRITDSGVVAETAVQAEESIGYVVVAVEAAGILSDPLVWSDALPVPEGATPGSARFRRDDPENEGRGFFRLRVSLIP